MGICYIVSGGEKSLGTPLYPCAGDFIIACDSGYDNAWRMGLPVDLLVGDFDSLEGDLPTDVEIVQAPTHKDDTDTMLAARIAVERGYMNVVLLCALGGRLDHTIANLQTLAYLCGQVGRCKLVSEDTVVWAVQKDTLVLEPMEGFGLSVFAWSGLCTGVYLDGVAYPLENASLTPSFPIGVSNQFTNTNARITVGTGMLMVMACRL